MYEVETKILDVDSKKIAQKLSNLGAKKILQTRLFVDWFRKPGVKEGKDKWFLRIRTNSKKQSELTWKSIIKESKVSRRSKEISFPLLDAQKTKEFLLAIDLELYAHQEKDRMSWLYKGWRFDLDKYPKMPAYLEIEGKNQKHVQEAIKLLNLGKHKAVSQGERVLIQKSYGLNWYKMKF